MSGFFESTQSRPFVVHETDDLHSQFRAFANAVSKLDRTLVGSNNQNEAPVMSRGSAETAGSSATPSVPQP